MSRAAALVHGQIIGKTVHWPGNPRTDVTVPAVYASGGSAATCFAFKPAVPASCQGPLPHSTDEVGTTTYVGRYPPLYYAIVGLPSLVSYSSRGIYLMRFIVRLTALAALSIVASSRIASC